MTDTRIVRKEMLIDPIEIDVEDTQFDFAKAKLVADKIARKVTLHPMLLAWFDKKHWRHSPAIVCGCGDKPSWIVYAQTRGGTISIDINDEDYVFLYRETEINN